LVPPKEWQGGKEYRPNEEELARLRHAAMIASGRRTVRFRLLRQDEEKQLEQTFDQAPLRNCMLSFDVRMRPAQGFARVLIAPDIPDLFGGKEVVLDWERMENADKSPEGSSDIPACSPLTPKNSWQADSYLIPAIKEYVSDVSIPKWLWAERSLKVVGTRMQSGAALGSDPSGPVIDTLRRALDQHRLHFEETGVFRTYEKKSPRDKHARALGELKNLLRAATALFKNTPVWAEQFLQKEFREAREHKPESPNPPPVFLNAAGRCFSHDHQIRLFVECIDVHFKARMSRWCQTGQSPGMNNWCKAFQLILRLNEEAVLHIERPQAESLARCLQLLLDAVEPRKRRLSAPYKQAMFSLYFLLRFRARPEGADFLSDWSHSGSTAQKIHANLSRHRDVGRSRQADLPNLGDDVTLQASLLRFLECKATAQDIIIMKKAHDESLESETEDDDSPDDQA